MEQSYIVPILSPSCGQDFFVNRFDSDTGFKKKFFSPSITLPSLLLHYSTSTLPPSCLYPPHTYYHNQSILGKKNVKNQIKKKKNNWKIFVRKASALTQLSSRWGVKNFYGDDNLFYLTTVFWNISIVLFHLICWFIKNNFFLRKIFFWKSKTCGREPLKKYPKKKNQVCWRHFRSRGTGHCYLTGIGFNLDIRLKCRLVWFIFCLPTEHLQFGWPSKDSFFQKNSFSLRLLCFVLVFFIIVCFDYCFTGFV